MSSCFSIFLTGQSCDSLLCGALKEHRNPVQMASATNLPGSGAAGTKGQNDPNVHNLNDPLLPNIRVCSFMSDASMITLSCF